MKCTFLEFCDRPKKGPKRGLEYVTHLVNAVSAILIVFLGCANRSIQSIMTLAFAIFNLKPTHKEPLITALSLLVVPSY